VIQERYWSDEETSEEGSLSSAFGDCVGSHGYCTSLRVDRITVLWLTKPIFGLPLDDLAPHGTNIELPVLWVDACSLAHMSSFALGAGIVMLNQIGSRLCFRAADDFLGASDDETTPALYIIKLLLLCHDLITSPVS
jgi:hypothetical protein